MTRAVFESLFLIFLTSNSAQGVSPKTIIILSRNSGGDSYSLEFNCFGNIQAEALTTNYIILENDFEGCQMRAQIQANGFPLRFTPWQTLSGCLRYGEVCHLIENPYEDWTIESQVTVTFYAGPPDKEMPASCIFYLNGPDFLLNQPEKHRVDSSDGNCVYQFPYNPDQWNYKIQGVDLFSENLSGEEFIYKCLAPRGCNLGVVGDLTHYVEQDPEHTVQFLNPNSGMDTSTSTDFFILVLILVCMLGICLLTYDPTRKKLKRMVERLRRSPSSATSEMEITCNL